VLDLPLTMIFLAVGAPKQHPISQSGFKTTYPIDPAMILSILPFSHQARNITLRKLYLAGHFGQSFPPNQTKSKPKIQTIPAKLGPFFKAAQCPHDFSFPQIPLLWSSYHAESG